MKTIRALFNARQVGELLADYLVATKGGDHHGPARMQMEIFCSPEAPPQFRIEVAFEPSDRSLP